MKFEQYPKYKPSGIDWLGDVPQHWIVKRSDAIVSADRSQLSADDFAGQDVFHYSIPVVQDTGTGRVENSDSIASAKQVIQKPVVLVSKLNPRKATICLARPQEILTLCSTEFVVLSADRCDLGFLQYLSHSELFRQRLDSKVQSVTRSHQRANPADIYKFWGVWPTLEEQRRITAFLDLETRRIDRLVAKKASLIERLQEKRAALISHAVTRGLPSTVDRDTDTRVNQSLKPSGVEWIGEIPEHWTVMKVKFVAKMESGHTPSRGERANWIEDECVIPWVSLNDTKFLKENDFIGDTAVKISEEGMKNSSAHLLPPGVVVFTRDATIGLTAITTCSAAVSQHIIAWVPGPKITAAYLLFSFKAMQQYLESFTFGSTLKTIGMTDVRKLVIPLPPLSEQVAIAAHLETATKMMDALMRKVEEAIERLQEYRTALITAAVTGKIDVRKATS